MARLRTHSGNLNTWVSIEKDTPTKDAYGGDVESWSLVARVPSEMNGLRGDERFVGDQHIGKTIYQFVIRARSDITKTMRLNIDGRIFDIISAPRPLPTNRGFLEILAEERD